MIVFKESRKEKEPKVIDMSFGRSENHYFSQIICTSNHKGTCIEIP